MQNVFYYICTALSEQADPESASPSNPDSCLATEVSLPTASSYFLHTPLPDLGEFNNIGSDSSAAGTSVADETPESKVAMVTRGGTQLINPPLPLLLNPELMKGTGIHLVSPQVHVSSSPLGMEWWHAYPQQNRLSHACSLSWLF